MFKRLWNWFKNFISPPESKTEYTDAMPLKTTPLPPPPVPIAPAPITVITSAPIVKPQGRFVPNIADFKTVLAFTDFISNGFGPFIGWNDGTHGTPQYMEIVDDGEGGKMCRITFETKGTGLESSDRNIEWDSPHKFRYNEPLLLRGKVTIHGTPANNANARKLIDMFDGGEPHTRLILIRENGTLHWAMGQYGSDGVWSIDRPTDHGDTGITLLDGVKYDVGVMILPNSADGVRDGVLQIFVDDMTKPAFTLDHDLMPITERDGGMSCFDMPRFGSQYTGQPGEPAVTEFRDWKDIGVYTTEVG